VHLLVRQTQTLDQDEAATDLGQSPADLVFLSFSDSDLGAVAAAWQDMDATRPTLRLANLARLRHPMSVDLYVESVITHARCVVVRLLGGLEYWRYGAEELAASCRASGAALAIVPGDARCDPRLAALSTVPAEALTRLDACLAQGGPANARTAILLAAQFGGLRAAAPPAPIHMPSAGEHVLAVPPEGPRGLAVIVFYRTHLLAGDAAPMAALAATLRTRGLGVRAIYVTSLKDPAAVAFVTARLRAWKPAVVLNATGFSARQQAGSPLDEAGVPVLQLVLAVMTRASWVSSSRGLSQTDLAMQVVLPELDGRLLAGVVSFKEDAEDVAGLDFRRVLHRPDADGIALVADRAAGWARLAATPEADRRIALVLSDYPGAAGGQLGHAVGLDSLASVDAIAALLHMAGYGISPSGDLAARLIAAEPAAILTLDAYRGLFATLPQAARQRVTQAWGDPKEDPSVIAGAFTLRYVEAGKLLIAVQPDRGHGQDRKAGYHDPDLPPRHAYVAFYLWLRAVAGIHAMIHLGTHGTLEWLPGKSVALSAACFPAALLRGLPVIYPFIVNNPGEAAAAKRRLGAVTIGHLTPPLQTAGIHGAACDLERRLDEFAAADGLDRRRTALLRRDILDRAASAGLLAESGVASGAPDDEALARLDAYLCDIKDLQIRDGLHVFGQAPSATHRAAAIEAMHQSCPGVDPAAVAAGLDASAPAEAAALLAALDGRLIAPGPAGAPTRGRPDVLPTGRNLFTVDPRAIPTRSALDLAQRAAEELLRRHRQDHGDWPRTLVIDLWASATMRTGGEDLALAYLLIGARPLWDEGSARVSGFEILPIALLDRPRIDVTLRISGLFRDAFDGQIQMFDAAIRAIAQCDEPDVWNPLAAAARGLDSTDRRRATLRVFGAAPGAYGAGISDLLERNAWTTRAQLGAAYLQASAYAYGRDSDGMQDEAAFAALVSAAAAFVHVQDHAEQDLLEGGEHAAHEGGFAAAADSLGAAPALYHLDTSRPEVPRARTVAEAVARTVRGRAANPAWIAGMVRHGYRGAAEIARALDGLFGFAATLTQRFDTQFDLLFDATLGDPATDAFLRDANPAAHAAMVVVFDDAIKRDFWRPRRNVPATLAPV
jgi:cobaltochelatase CobN